MRIARSSSGSFAGTFRKNHIMSCHCGSTCGSHQTRAQESRVRRSDVPRPRSEPTVATQNGLDKLPLGSCIGLWLGSPRYARSWS